MSITPLNNQEKYSFFDFERKVQLRLDEFYISRGRSPDRTQADEFHDVILDGWKIEEKIRGGIWPDVLIEISQDIVSGAIGWFGKTKCDYLHYVFCPDDKTPVPIILYRIKWVTFKEWFIKSYLPAHKSGKYIYSDRGWGATINIPVQISLIPETIINKYKIETDGI